MKHEHRRGFIICLLKKKTFNLPKLSEKGYEETHISKGEID